MEQNEREALLRCFGVEQMVDLLAYAETRALMAAGLSVPTEPPEVLARAAIEWTLQRQSPLRGFPWAPSPGAVVDQLRSHVRAATSLAMKNRARSVSVERGVGALLSVAQLGSLDGIEKIAHLAGEQAPPIRAEDMATIGKAIELAGLARARLRGS